MLITGEPYVYTVDIRNRVEVEKTLKKIKEQPLNEPFVPHEFTYEGFLQVPKGVAFLQGV